MARDSQGFGRLGPILGNYKVIGRMDVLMPVNGCFVCTYKGMSWHQLLNTDGHCLMFLPLPIRLYVVLLLAITGIYMQLHYVTLH
jgi:hypothetical protein